MQRVPRVVVTMDAQHHFARIGGQHLMHEIGMTVDAGTLRYPPIARLDLNRLMEILERKRQRMKETVIRLGYPLSKRMVR